MKKTIVWILLSAGLPVASFAQSSIYKESFEATASNSLPPSWITRFGQSNSNPLVAGSNQSSRVLSFSSATFGGDTSSAPFDLSPYKNSGQRILLSFNFLSSATTNHAGLIGLTSASNAPQWFGGSPSAIGSGVTNYFSGTGSWQPVTIDVTSYLNTHSLTELQTSRVTFERWSDSVVSGITPVYFDDLAITAIPSPVSSQYFTDMFTSASLDSAYWRTQSPAAQQSSSMYIFI